MAVQNPAISGEGCQPAVASVLAGRRFTFVLAWATFGGAERQVFHLARYLRQRGATVDVCALTDRDGESQERFGEAGIPWQPLPFKWPRYGRAAKTAALISFAWRLRARSPDVLMPYCSRPNILCGLTWRLAGASTRVWHQQDVNPVTRFSASLVRRAANSTPVLVSNSEHGIDHLVESTGVPRERVFCTPNVLELPSPVATRAEWLARLGAGEGDFVAAMVAHLRPGKDVATLLRAWVEVRDALAASGRGAVLAVGGTGPTEAQAKATAFDLGLSGSVRFLGHVGDVAGLLAACDTGVLSSLREGCPTFALEAMAAGRPVVGTNIPGMREAVGPDGYDHLVPIGDADALAAALVRVADDPEGSRRLGARNMRRIEERFSVARAQEVEGSILVRALVGRRA